MSFHLFWQSPFSKTHEIDQAEFVLNELKRKYAESEDYCYCLANGDFWGDDGNKAGQYDLVVITRHSVSVIELKAKTGTLTGKLSSNYNNEPLLFSYDSGCQELIRPSQVEKQKKFLLKKLNEYFRYTFKKNPDPEEHYQIDCFLLFNGVDLTDYHCENEQIGKWFHITSRRNFLGDWEHAVHDGNFTITEGDATFIAERILLMKEANPNDFWKRNISLQDRISAFYSQSGDLLVGSLDYAALKAEVLEYINPAEYETLLSLSANIMTISDSEKEQFRLLVRRSGIPYFTRERMEHLFLSELLKAFLGIFKPIETCFLEIPRTYDGRMDTKEATSTSSGKLISALSVEYPDIPSKVIAILHEYDEYCYSRKINHVVNNEENTILTKGLSFLRIANVMEK